MLVNLVLFLKSNAIFYEEIHHEHIKDKRYALDFGFFRIHRLMKMIKILLLLQLQSRNKSFRDN